MGPPLPAYFFDSDFDGYLYDANFHNIASHFARDARAASEQLARESTSLVNTILNDLKARHDHILAWDCRHERVTELREDPDNKAFWENFEVSTGRMPRRWMTTTRR